MSIGASVKARWQRPLGIVPTVVVGLVVLLAPLLLFGDSLTRYRLYSDDFAYIAASRTWPRTIENLFLPHNTHIVPAWRLLMWVVVACAGSLERTQEALAVATYGTLVLALMLVGHFVARETGRAASGLVAMVLLGSTSVMRAPSTWFSAAQALWAGIAVLMMLVFLQGWKRFGGAWRLALGVLSAALAGWFWTVGYVAGPVGLVYLWADGQGRCRKASALPLLGAILAVAIALGLGGRRIDATISFHGRTSGEALNPGMGVAHTVQAIPENLMFGNLGVVAPTTIVQGAVLTLALAAAWGWSRLRRGWVSPLELAGGALVVGSYLIEWSFRGYFPFSSLRGIVPWYDTIPQIGAVLFVSGWWAGSTENEVKSPSRLRLALPTPAASVGIVALLVAFLTVHRPRIDALLIHEAPEMSAEEQDAFRIPKLKKLRALYLLDERSAWQRRALTRLDLAEAAARRLGIGRDGIEDAFGRVEVPGIPDVYDAADMLGLPREGTEDDPVVIRRALQRFFVSEPEPKVPIELIRWIESLNPDRSNRR